MSVDTNQYQNSLANQAAEIIDADTDWIKLADQLEVDRYQYGDAHPEWRKGTPFRPMFLSYLWTVVEDESLSALHTRLGDDAELAEAFGFEPDGLPSASTFRPVRVKSRFETLERLITHGGESIRDLDAERGAPLGFDLGKSDDATEESDPSNRTIQRLLRKKGREVLDELKSVAIPSLTLPRSDDAIYDSDELLTVEAIAAVQQAAANGSGDTMGDLKNPSPNFDDAFYEDGPSGETLLEAIKGLSVEEIATMMNFALQKMYTREKPRLNDLDELARSVHVAIDVTYVGFYGETAEMEWLQGTPRKNRDKKPYDWCHKFATIIIVGENTHYTVGVLPLGSVENADNNAYPGTQEQSYYRGDIVRKLLSIASDFVDIRMVYADREFHVADAIHALEEYGVKYVIPAQKDPRIQRVCDRFDGLKSGYEDEERDAELYVQDEYAIHAPVKHKPGTTRVTTRLVVLPPDEADDTHEEGSPQPFFTNLEVSDEIALDRRWARKQINRYSSRGAIESSYSSIKECAAWTTSREFEVRWFHFGFGCLVYNQWLLTDFLTQSRIDVIETLTEPRITLSRFLTWLDKELMTLL